MIGKKYEVETSVDVSETVCRSGGGIVIADNLDQARAKAKTMFEGEICAIKCVDRKRKTYSHIDV